MIYRGIAFNGTAFVRLESDGHGFTVDGAYRPLTYQPLFPRIAAAGEDFCVVSKSSSPGDCRVELSGGASITLGSHVGAWSHAVQPTLGGWLVTHVCAADGNTGVMTCAISFVAYDGHRGLVQHVNVPYREGILSVDYKGVPVPYEPYVSPHGDTLTLPSKAGLLVVGTANRGGVGVQVFDTALGQLHRVSHEYTNVPPAIAVNALGVGEVAVSADVGGFYPESAWTPEPAEAGAHVPPIAPITTPKILGAFPPGTMAGANVKLVYEDGFYDLKGRKVLGWVDTEEDIRLGRDWVKIIRDTPSPKIVYWVARFTLRPPPPEFWHALSDGDFVSCPLYREAAESLAWLETSGRQQIVYADQRGHQMVLVGGFWNRGFLSEQAVLDCGPVYRRLIDEPACAGLLAFGITRGATISPPQFLPSFQVSADQFTAPLPAFGAVLPAPTVRPFPSRKRVSMSHAIVGVLGPGGFYGRVDPSEVNAEGRATIHWDRTSIGGHEEVEVIPIDGENRSALRFVAANVVINGAPDWDSHAGLTRQFETRKADAIGGDEKWLIEKCGDGRIEAVVSHKKDGRAFSSAPLTLVDTGKVAA